MKRTIIAVALFTALSTSAIAADNTWKDDTKDAWIDGKAEATLLFNTKLNSFDINTDVVMGKVILTGKVENEAEKELAEELVRGIDGVTDVENSLTILDTDMVRNSDVAMKNKMNGMDNKSATEMKHDMKDMDKKSSTAMKHDMKDMDKNAHNDMEHKMDGMKDKSHTAMNNGIGNIDANEEMDDNDDSSMITDAKISTVVKSRLLLESEISGTDIDVDVENRVVTLNGSVKSETERQLVVSIAENTDDVDSVNDELMVKPESK